MNRYHLAEVFDTVQGEGAQVGQRMVFVRFAGCNLWNGTEEGRERGAGQCARWCDTDFRPKLSLALTELLSRMDALWPVGVGARWCCLTGGEPLLQVDEALCVALRRAGWSIAVETNGTAPFDLRLADHVTFSPKLDSSLALENCHALKVVLPGGQVGWTAQQLDDLAGRFSAASLFVQPQDGDARGLSVCLDFVRARPWWRLSLQAHKLIGIS